MGRNIHTSREWIRLKQKIWSCNKPLPEKFPICKQTSDFLNDISRKLLIPEARSKEGENKPDTLEEVSRVPNKKEKEIGKGGTWVGKQSEQLMAI